MKYSVATVLALATAVLARPKFTNSNYDVVEGEPFTLKWDSAEGNVKISLYKGKSGDQNSFKPVETLTTTTGATGSFTFTPASSLNGDYAFVIEDDSGDLANFSPAFTLAGDGAVTSSASASASASITSSAESSTKTVSSTETETSSETSTAATTLETTTTVPTTTRRQQVTETPTPPPNTNNGQRFASSLALVLGTVAALVFFN